MLAALLLSLVCVSPAFAQPRYGASIYVQDAEPTAAAVTQGQFWFAPSNSTLKIVTSTNPSVWATINTGGGGESVPAGSILLIASGTCPTGYTEESALDGKTIIGTLAAHGDIGTTGGSDTITSVLNHTHTVNITDPGHTHNQGIRNSGTAGTVGVQGASTANNATIANAVPSATTGITASTANPAGGVASIDNRSAFTRVIFCTKT